MLIATLRTTAVNFLKTSFFMKKFFKLLSPLFTLLVIFGIFIAHLESPIKHCGDCKWSIYTAKSIYKQGNHNLREYHEEVRRINYGILPVNHKLYNFFPPGAAYFAVPIVAAFTEFPKFGLLFLSSIESEKSTPEKRHVDVVKGAPHMEKLVASFAIALTALVLYLIGRLKLNIFSSWLIVGIFSFATSAWSVASRALWPHAPSMLMLSLALYLSLRFLKLKKINYLSLLLPLLIGIVLAFSYIVRPSNALSILCFGLLFCITKNLRVIFAYTLGIATLILPFIYLSYKLYGEPLPPYFQSSRLRIRPDFWAVFTAQLISPSRGFLVFTPIFIFSLIGFVKNLRVKKDLLISITLANIIFFHLLAISSIPTWWGGTTYGPRFMSDMLPYCCFFLMACLAFLNKISFSKKLIFWPSFLLLALLSLWINARGVYCTDTMGWNNKPQDVNRNTHRIFDWSDPQFLRGINFKTPDRKYLCRF